MSEPNDGWGGFDETSYAEMIRRWQENVSIGRDYLRRPTIDLETNKIIKPESNPIFSKPLPLP